MRSEWIWAAAIVLLMPGACRAGEGFSFPADKAGQLLARLLRPDAQPTSSPEAAPKPRSGSRLDNVDMPLQPLTIEPPRGKPELFGRRAPHPPAQGPAAGRQDPVRPAIVTLPPGVRIRLPSVDVNQPIPLPLLGVAQPDRAPLTDPTVSASLAAALASPIPERSAPAAFLRLSVPDPFENSRAVGMRTPLPENPNPPSAQPRRPGRPGR